MSPAATKEIVPEVNEIDALCEMFREIDVNGDGSMQWEEFTSHLVELASTYYDDRNDDSVPRYNYSLMEDTSTHDYHCELLLYVRGIDQVVLFERSSRRFKLYDPETLRCTKIVRGGHRGPMLGAEYIQEQNLLVTTAQDKTIYFWALKVDSHGLPSLSKTMMWATQKSMICAKWNSSMNILFTADTRGVVWGWGLERGDKRMCLQGHKDVVMDISFIENVEPPLIATCSLDLTIRTWNVTTGDLRGIMKGHEKGIICMAYCKEVTLLISGGLDSYCLVWNPIVKNPVFTIKNASNLAHCVGLECVKGTAEVVIGTNLGVFTVYCLRTFCVLQQFQIPKLKNPLITNFSMCSYDGEIVACGHKLHKFERTSGVKNGLADDNPILYAKFNPVSLTFITVAGSGVKIWDALTGRLERVDRNLTDTAITAVCLDDRNRRYIIADHNGFIKVYNYSNGAFMKNLDRHESECTWLQYISEQKDIVSCSWDKTVCLHTDSMHARRTSLRRAHEHTKDVLQVVTSSSLKLIASVSSDCTICIHDMGLGPIQERIKISSLASAIIFLDPFPLLLVCHVNGNVSIFHLFRRVNFHYAKVLEETNYTRGKSRCISCVCWCESHHNLFAGDESGIVKLWDLSVTLRELGFRANTDKREKPVEKDQRHVRIRPNATLRRGTAGGLHTGKSFGAAALIKLEQERKSDFDAVSSDSSDFDEDQDDKALNNELIGPPKISFRAHRDSVLGMDYVIETLVCPTLITWAFDGSVHLWNANNGGLLGSLFQGHNKRHPVRTMPWGFHFNLDLHVRREREFLTTALEKPEEEVVFRPGDKKKKSKKKKKNNRDKEKDRVLEGVFDLTSLHSFDDEGEISDYEFGDDESVDSLPSYLDLPSSSPDDSAQNSSRTNTNASSISSGLPALPFGMDSLRKGGPKKKPKRRPMSRVQSAHHLGRRPKSAVLLPSHRRSIFEGVPMKNFVLNDAGTLSRPTQNIKPMTRSVGMGSKTQSAYLRLEKVLSECNTSPTNISTRRSTTNWEI